MAADIQASYAAHMEARNLPDALKLIMKQREWSQVELARELGISQPFVSNLVAGKRETTFTKALRLLDRVGWQVRITPKPEDDDPVKRREFVAAAASVAFAPSPNVGPFQDPAYLRALARRTARDRYEHGGTASVSTAMRHMQRIKQALDGRDRHVQAAASDVAVEAVWTLNDVRRFDVGENVGRLALELAQRSGDVDAQSKAYSVLAQVQKLRGDADRALWYSQHGIKLHEVPPDQQLWMAQRLSESLSKVPGQERAAHEVVEDLRAALSDAQNRAELSAYEVADITGNIGRTLYDLGAYREAQECLDGAVQGLGHSAPLLQGYNLAYQVMASLRAAQPAFAADRMLALARIAPLVDSVRLDGYLREVLTASAHWRAVPEVDTARTQLRTVLQGGSTDQQP